MERHIIWHIYLCVSYKESTVKGELGTLTTRMTKSLEADATIALFELTAKSVMSPLEHAIRRLNFNTWDKKIQKTTLKI